MLTGMIFGFRARIRIYLCFRTFMKSKSLLQIDLHAFVLSIMIFNLHFLLFIFIYFILNCSVHFSAFVANKNANARTSHCMQKGGLGAG